MDFNKKKSILKKLVNDQLGSAEEQELFYCEPVTKLMLTQWDNCQDETGIPASDKNKIFRAIQKRISSDKRLNPLYYKISLAASFLLIIGLTSIIYLFTSEKKTFNIYTISAGIQNTESVTLPDGTTVQLGAGSKIIFPEYFTGNSREVTVCGQAFFDVTADSLKPFIVHTPQMDITVLGTAFELFSHDIENVTEAILLKGKLKVDILTNTNNDRQIILLPDEKVALNKQTGAISKEKVDADKYTSWRKDGILSFENEKLSMIIPRLEQWYGRKIICPKELSEKYRFTFKVRDETLERILYMIQKSSPLKYTKTGEGNFTIHLK